MIGLGSIYGLAVDVFDASGQPANAATFTAVFTLPDGSTVTPAVANPPAVTGQYRYAYLTTMAGRHTVYAVTTGPATEWDDSFDVRGPVPDGIISLSDAKRRLNIAPAVSTWDGELRDWIAAMTATIEKLKGEVIARRTVTETTHGKGRTFRLWNTPVISLTSVASEDGTVTWDPANMHVRDSGLARVISGPPVRGRLITVHEAGYQVIPGNYVEAGLVILANLWAGEERGSSVRPGGETDTTPRTWKGEYWGFVPKRAQELLGLPGPVVA